MNITTREGREELRRGPSKDELGVKYVNARLAALPRALDGLDIAEVAMRALTTMKALSDLPPDYPDHLMEAELANWRDSAEWALDGALAEWDKWCS